MSMNGISRGVLAAVVVAVVVVAVAGYVGYYYATHPKVITTTVVSTTSTATTVTTTTAVTSTVVSSTATTVTTTTSTATTATVAVVTTTTTAPYVVKLTASNPSELIDVSQVAAPDCLDPATGFYVQDGPIFAVVFQGLVGFNGSNYMQIVPVIAKNWSTPDDQHWYFTIRHHVWFSNGDPVNATTVWFSIYRIILMGQGPGISNYGNILYNITKATETGYFIPWGACHALAYATGNNAYLSNATLCAYALANVLSNFNVANATIQKIMSYPNQAVVVLNPFEVEITTLKPYPLFLTDIAAWWGFVVDPVFIDMNGGVQPNAANSKLCTTPMPGTGPYVIKSYTPGEELLLVNNTNYWVYYYYNHGMGNEIPWIIQPAHITYIDVKYGLSTTDRIEDFVKNIAQITTVSTLNMPALVKLYSSATGIPSGNWSLYIHNFGPSGCVFYLSFNNYVWPTNDTNFRLAIVHALNATALLQPYYALGMYWATTYVGPIAPNFKPYYNPDNLPVYQYNLTLALQYLVKFLNKYGYYVVLPNGSAIGDTSGTQLPTINIVTLAPLTEFTKEQFEIIQSELAQIGVPVSLQLVTASATDDWVTPSATPAIVDLGWCPDWPDPLFQEMWPLANIINGGISGNLAWYNNSLVNNITNELPFITNLNEQLKLDAEVYKIMYEQAPYYWLPTGL
ncbi:ABC transporter substrate-binding protein, partial [Caldivirga sp. UBA161]|uniref:ABC transporter substrate-binding protein n=1 Tax=Caldivirga sp. UBA161 TaxID=1915569 RepID=UPI0025C348E2